MKDQFEPLGLSFDWSKEVTTCEPDYYAHQQRIFLKMLENDLVYRRSAKVNWDPVENTVLANEQVVDGRGWRSGAVVEQRELEQWFFRITRYGDDLLAALMASTAGRKKSGSCRATGSARARAPASGGTSRTHLSRCRATRTATAATTQQTRSRFTRHVPTHCSARRSSPSPRIIR